MREIEKEWSKTSFGIFNPSPKNENGSFAPGPQVSRLTALCPPLTVLLGLGIVGIKVDNKPLSGRRVIYNHAD